MRCPVCRCETGNQSVCPYCGTTVYTGNTTYTMTDYSRHTQQMQNTYQQTKERGRVSDKKLRRIETKLDLLMVLQLGSFLLLLVVLIMMALK